MINKNTQCLWESIKQMGNFTDSYYDQMIERKMLVELGVRSSKELYTMEPEKVLNAFFKSISPFTSMYSDILCLFENCKAKGTTQNIEIEFQSEAFSSSKFSIEHFIHAKKLFQTIRVKQNLVVLNDECTYCLWNFWIDEPYDGKRNNIHNTSYHKWIEAYYEHRENWPDVDLDFIDRVADSEIKEQLLKAYKYWQAYFDYCQIMREDRASVQKNYRELDKADILLIMPEIDLWLGHVLTELYYIVEYYSTYGEDEQEKVKSKLQVFMENYQEKIVYIDEIAELLQSFLMLPVWKKRHEVYSIWIFTRIMQAFSEENVEYHLDGHLLCFPFAAKCLASIMINQKVFDVWTEVRTAVVKPLLGKGRTNAIQPDYSIVCGDANNILDTLITIECKQYKKQNTSNFSNAMIDYAQNRPNAYTLLVDYGQIKFQSMKTRLQGYLEENRYKLFSECQPGNPSAMDFTDTIYKTLSESADVYEITHCSPISFILTWDNTSVAQDLDLHLHLADEKDNSFKMLSYSFYQIEGAVYSGDIRKGPGPESIVINQWVNGIYDLWVHNYTGSLKFEEVNPILRVQSSEFTSDREVKIKSKHGNHDTWWHVLKIETNKNRCTIINELCDKMNTKEVT